MFHNLTYRAFTNGTVAFGTNVVGVVSAVRREIVETIRKAVDMVHKYAGYYLSGDAQNCIRSFILNLPSRLVIL